jgi:hypothetical protein
LIKPKTDASFTIPESDTEENEGYFSAEEPYNSSQLPATLKVEK